MSSPTQVTRTADGTSARNTLRPPVRTAVYWASPQLRLAVQAGWYVHAVSVGGAGRQFDPQTARGATWEHVPVQAEGRVDLRLAADRSYRFYLTPDPESDATLLAAHLPWPVLIDTRPGDSPESVLLFPTPAADFDGPPDVATSPLLSADTPIYQALAFASDEHESLADVVPGTHQDSAQRMIDYWALNGLIGGGALIDTKGPNDGPAEWDVLTPAQGPAASPYGSPSTQRNYHWHYIVPNPDHDANGNPWTSDSLKAAVTVGKAAVLTLGQLLMLPDFFGSFDELHDPAPRGPVNVAAGYDAADRFAYMLLDAISFPAHGKSLGSEELGLAEWMQAVARNEEAALNKLHWRKVEAVVRAIRRARGGTTRFQEIHLLSRTVTTGGTGLDGLESLCPWLAGMNGDLADALSAEEIGRLRTTGFDDRLFSMVATNGHYAELALNNESHFSDKRGNLSAFADGHRAALGVVNAVPTTAPHPIPAEAVARTAFALHFLSDSFSAGHMRVPRGDLGLDGALASKAMHDFDGKFGLRVTNGFGDRWRAFGDGLLDPDRFGTDQQKMLAVQSRPDQPELGRRRAWEAVGAAFKQLRYCAQARYDPAGRGPYHGTLRRTRGASATDLMFDRYCGEGWPADGHTVEEKAANVRADPIGYMERFWPRVIPNGSESAATADPYGAPNYPPLFLGGRTINRKDYSVDTGKAWKQRILVLKDWPPENLTLDLSPLYYLALATRNGGGWLQGGEQVLLRLCDAKTT